MKGDTMIDANVLIHSLRSPAFVRAAPQHVRDMISAAKALMMAMPVVRMSTVSFGEFIRKMSAEERATLAADGKSLDDFFAEPLTGEMARLAAALVDRRDPKKDDLCPRCLNPRRDGMSSLCKICNGTPSPHKRMDDAFIVATAARAHNVRRLVTADGGIFELRNILRQPEITKQFPGVAALEIEFLKADHGPLFESVEPPATEAPADAQPAEAPADRAQRAAKK